MHTTTLKHVRYHSEPFLTTPRTWLAVLLEGRDTGLAVVLSTADCDAEVLGHTLAELAEVLTTYLSYKTVATVTLFDRGSHFLYTAVLCGGAIQMCDYIHVLQIHVHIRVV